MGRKKRRVVEHKQVSIDRKPRRGFAVDVIISIVAIIIALIPFCYGKYCEFNTPGIFDGGLNIYNAKMLVDGHKLNVDVFVSTRPGTLLVNVLGVGIFGYSEFGPKLIQMLMQITAFGLMFIAVRKIYGATAAGFSLILAVFYLSCPMYAKYGNVKDQYMIACMLISASGFLLYHSGGKWWWLAVSAGAAINAYYFKPTGASIAVAIIVYQIFQPILRRCSLKQSGRELVFMAAGMVVGLSPLILFYLWQGRLALFMRRFPASIVTLSIICFTVYGIVKLAYKLLSKKFGEGFEAKVKAMPWRKIGVAAAVLMVIYVLVVVFGRGPGGPAHVLKKMPVISVPTKLIVKWVNPLERILREATGSGQGYVSASKQATEFAKQFIDMFKYYHRSFVVPIGVGVLAIILWVVELIGNIFKRKSKPAKQASEQVGQADEAKANPEIFVLFLGVWWVLDVWFGWVSPRAYVEYFLPLNGSGAMLAGYVVYKCMRKNWAIALVPAACLAADFVIAYGIRDLLFEGDGVASKYLKMRVVEIIIVAVCGGVWFAGWKFKLKRVAAVVIAVGCVWSWFLYNQANIKSYEERVDSVAKTKQQGGMESWQVLGKQIHDNTVKGDGLYVWGWMPGIYWAADRFSPTTDMVAYGNMHSESPKMIGRKINKLVKELEANPPKYIVDTQKIHYPFYEHPVFDLWPCWDDRKAGRLHLRIYPQQQYNYRQMFGSSEYEKNKEYLMIMTENWTKSVLMSPNRAGGAMGEEKASKLAQVERERHEAMEPLREFVMENYRLNEAQIPGFVLFVRK